MAILGRSPIHPRTLCSVILYGLICRIWARRKLEEALDAVRLQQIEQNWARVNAALKELEQIEDNGRTTSNQPKIKNNTPSRVAAYTPVGRPRPVNEL